MTVRIHLKAVFDQGRFGIAASEDHWLRSRIGQTATICDDQYPHGPLRVRFEDGEYGLVYPTEFETMEVMGDQDKAA